ncbi:MULTISPECIES: helix-turn-helix domain-containing protein [unclassified Bradyrhizobium]|uniref:helix-turn-helix domain-containing protein n=1 Tax=unclassified Bradyrhizobium TaxID=2631580 RepID=UPI002FEF02B7
MGERYDQLPDTAQVSRAYVRRLRVARQMSQEELAHAAELSQDQISEIENAKHSTTLDNIQRLAFPLGVAVAELLEEQRG